MLFRHLLPVAFLIVLCACSTEPDRPHIVLISIDTLRWDYLGAYGYTEPEISPTVNWLAENGTVFEQAVASAGTTVPSHGTMLTGLYPRHHGARSNRHGLYPETDTIARALGDAGYATGAFLSVRFMHKAGELNRGFQADNLAVLDASAESSPQTGENTLAQAFDWLGSLEPDQPVFLFLHLWEPHIPFEPSDWSDSRILDDAGFLEDGVTVEHLHQRADEIRNSPQHLAAMRAIYAGEVNRVDGILGQFFDEWRRRGLLDESLVVFTADHGEGLGEDGHFGHGPTHQEQVIRVPLIVADFREPRPQRVATRVGTIDIAPTLADAAGLEGQFDGIGYSLLDTATLDPAKPYFAEVELRTSKMSEEKLQAPWYDPDAVGVWVEDLKLVSRHGGLELRETYTDARLPTPIAPADEAIMLEYMTGLIESFRETELDLSESELSEELQQELKGLGYVQ